MNRKEWIELLIANFDCNGDIRNWNTVLLKKEYIASITKWGDRCCIKLNFMGEGSLLADITYEDLLIELFA